MGISTALGLAPEFCGDAEDGGAFSVAVRLSVLRWVDSTKTTAQQVDVSRLSAP